VWVDLGVAVGLRSGRGLILGVAVGLRSRLRFARGGLGFLGVG
jgi:hypothetical protein